MVIIKKESIDDISYLSLPIFHSLAVARWEIVGIYNQRKTYLEYLIARLRTFSSDKHISLYLIVGDDNFNENSKIINYYKLWKSLKKQKLEVENGVYLEEICFQKEGKVKFLGAIQIIDANSVTDVVNILLHRLNSHLLLLPSGEDVTEFLKHGFSRIISENNEYIKQIANRGGVVLFREGNFDDNHTGFLGFGAIPLIDEDLFEV
ncbi:TPA: hypothetical protein ACGO5U_002048 [Streptococcus suis]|jgi:hypothetical protein